MRRRTLLRAQLVASSIHAAIQVSNRLRRAMPVILLTGTLFAGAAVWLTSSVKANHWVWKGWERLFGPPTLTSVKPRIFAQIDGGDYIISPVNEPSAGTSALQGTLVTAVNASGTMTGAYSEVNGVTHGFIDANGTFTSFDAMDESGLNPPAGSFQ
jgi:hypothetical protein